ncbi:MAG TPA: hypothetical protein VFF49_06625 [Thermodesulfobacteriota bacterium]|nr:hypothetical protein [Thermodesulfobacteriota bacterium]
MIELIQISRAMTIPQTQWLGNCLFILLGLVVAVIAVYIAHKAENE